MTKQTNPERLIKSLAKKAKERGWVLEDMLAYLLKTNMISTAAQNAYLVIEYYPGALAATESQAEPRGVKRKAVWDIADELGLAESTVWGYIAHHSSRFWE